MLRLTLLGLCCTASFLLWIPDPASPPRTLTPLDAVTQGLRESSLADFARFMGRL
jgi:hypothetical protein